MISFLDDKKQQLLGLFTTFLSYTFLVRGHAHHNWKMISVQLCFPRSSLSHLIQSVSCSEDFYAAVNECISWPKEPASDQTRQNSLKRNKKKLVHQASIPLAFCWDSWMSRAAAHKTLIKWNVKFHAEANREKLATCPAGSHLCSTYFSRLIVFLLPSFRQFRSVLYYFVCWETGLWLSRMLLDKSRTENRRAVLLFAGFWVKNLQIPTRHKLPASWRASCLLILHENRFADTSDTREGLLAGGESALHFHPTTARNPFADSDDIVIAWCLIGKSALDRFIAIRLRWALLVTRSWTWWTDCSRLISS